MIVMNRAIRTQCVNNRATSVIMTATVARMRIVTVASAVRTRSRAMWRCAVPATVRQIAVSQVRHALRSKVVSRPA